MLHLNSYRIVHGMCGFIKSNLNKYAIKKKSVNADHFLAKQIIDKIMDKSVNDKAYCERAYTWLKGDKCTLLLRDLAKDVGFDYHENINNSNAIDRIEIAWMKMSS